jgi:hypothetical protein
MLRRPQDRAHTLQEKEDFDRRQAREIQSEIIEIQKIRGELESLATRLQEQCDRLRTRVRLTASLDANPVVTYTNANIRMAGVVLQVSRRTASLDRVLRIGEAEKREQERLDAQRQRREERVLREAENSRRIQGSGNDFEELFGDFDYEEGVSDA